MVYRPLLWSFLALTLASTVACGGNGPGDPTGSTCPSSSALTYADFGQAFMQNNCLGCHTNNQAPSLATLDEIRVNADAIDRAAAAGPNGVNTYMPQDGSVSDSERRQLGEWLACGAPE